MTRRTCRARDGICDAVDCDAPILRGQTGEHSYYEQFEVAFDIKKSRQTSKQKKEQWRKVASAARSLPSVRDGKRP